MSSIGLARTFGVDVARDDPSIPPRSLRHMRVSAAVVGAVGGVAALALTVLGVVPATVGVAAAAFGLGLLAARLASRPVFEPPSPDLGRLLGVSSAPTQAVDEAWTARLHELDRDRVVDAWQMWLSGARDEPFRADYRLLAEDGRTIWVDDVTLSASHGGGRPTLRRHLRDVTRERRLEEQLRQAQRLELLGRLAAGVAHDFNNLLAVISGYASRLAAPLPRQAREDSSVAIAAAAERGASLVRQLLAFSRPQPTDSRVVDLNDVVRDFAPMLRRVIGEDVELDLRLEAHRLPVNVHPVQIDQVLMNVAVNARDAMPGGGRLTISTWRLGGAAIVTVSDTGVGMDPATQEQIFEPFFTTKEPATNSGLGLATAHRIVQRAGGSMTVSSAPAAGTTFSVELPLAATAEMPALREAVADSTAPDGGPETVLVVEDEPALRELEIIMLEEAGYDVLAAANAAEALVVAAENAIDLIVVDVVMPGMSGPQLVEELAARGCDVPTVFVSGYGPDEISSRGLETGTRALIEKPFGAELLLCRVREVLDGAARFVPHAGAAG